MKPRVTLKTAIKVTKIAVSVIASWPLPPDASHSTVLKRNIYWWFVVIHCGSQISSYICDIIRSIPGDIDHAILICAELAAVIPIFAKMVICRVHNTRIRDLLTELESFMNRADQEELDVIQSYVDKCLYSHTLIPVAAAVSSVAFILSPVITRQPFPSDMIYPFSVESTWIWAATYLLQSMVIAQAGSVAILDLMFAILLWYAGAKIQNLVTKVERVITPEDVRRCIRQHQDLLEYIKRMKEPVLPMALEVTFIAMFAVPAGGLVLLRRPPIHVLAKFTLFEVVAALELFLFTWPADNIMDLSEKLAVAAFCCDWIGKSPDMMKDVLLLMQKAQTPIVINVPGIIPALTLEFYTTVMKVAFSYITTLRVITDN